ncbi:MAG: hypothetical protein VX684_03870 [Planctomycetota bacterium]|nr:hypothetical protein [Planctomycetota bacterium]
MAGRPFVRILAPLLSILVGLPAIAVPAPQETVDTWLEERGLDRLRMHALRARVADRSLRDDQRERLTEQLLAVYRKLLAESPDPAFRDELTELIGLILDEISVVQGDPIRLDLYTSEWRALITSGLNALLLRRGGEVDDQALLASMLDLSDRIDELLRRTTTRSRRANQELREAQGAEVLRRTRSFDELEDTLRKLRSLSGWVHAYLGWFTDDVAHANVAQRMFASLLSSDGSPFVVPSDGEVSVQRRSEDWYAELIIGMAIAQAPEASFATVEAWLDLLAIESASESARRQVPFYRLALLLGGDDPDRFREAERLLGELGPAASSDCLRLACIEALVHAEDDPGAAAMVPALLERLADRGEILELVDLSTRFPIDSLPPETSLFHFMRGCRSAIQSRSEDARGEDAAARGTALAALADLDLVLEDAGEATDPLARQALVLRAELNQFLGRPLAAARDFSSAAGRAEGTEAGDLLWRGIAALPPTDPPAADPEVDPLRTSLIDRLLSAHPTHPRAQAAKLLRLEMQQEYGLRDAEELLQTTNDPATSGLALRKAASILYQAWSEASGALRAELGARFIELVDQPEVVSAEGRFAEPDLGLLLALLRVSLQSEPPDLARSRGVIDAIDLASAERPAILADRGLEFEALRFEHDLLAPTPDLSLVVERLGRFAESPEDPASRRCALLAVLAANHHLDGNPTPPWTSRHRAALSATRTAVAMLVGESPSVEQVSEPRNWQLVRSLAAAEYLAHLGDGDQASLLRAHDLYAVLLEERPMERSALSGYARASTALGRDAEALRAWRVLMNNTPEGTDEFLESKYHTLSLLAETDRDLARSILEQHLVLYPDYGPSPWGPELASLHRALGTRGRGGP